jgi:pyruvate/2-oxoglutarate dehydrogenase complex dihydrolipoamide dehydrogenase (E3) component
MDYELAVIGGGAAGLAAAQTAVRAGRRVVLVSDGPPGGDCTFTGCVPSKTLIEAAAAGVSFPVAIAQVQDTIERIATTESAEALRRQGIDVRSGRASFADAHRIEIDAKPLTADRIVIATGTDPAVPRFLADADPLTTDTVWSLDRLPESLAIIGGGAVGCELAQALSRLGARITLIEMTDRLLPIEEPDASAIVQQALERDGVDIRLGIAVEKARPGELTLAGGETISAERLLVAAGRRPDTAGLHLQRAGVTIDGRGFVTTTDDLRTTTKTIYAAGDITGRLAFTHAADAMGRLAAHNAFRRVRGRFDAAPIPWVTFTDPEVARIGVREDQAGPDARVAYLPLDEVDRALTAGRPEGFIKLIAGPRRGTGRLAGGRILGATIVAPRAGEMIGEIALAMRTRMFTGRLAQTTHPYPTYSTGIQQAVAQFFTTIGGRTAKPARHVGQG